MTDYPHGTGDATGRPVDQKGKPVSAPRDDFRRHVTTACRRWKRTWDRTSQVPADMIGEIIAAADAYALAYARDCLRAVARRDAGDLAGLIDQLAGTTGPDDRNTT